MIEMRTRFGPEMETVLRLVFADIGQPPRQNPRSLKDG
jgi:hypothetical protein